MPVLAEFLHESTIIKRTADCDSYFSRLGPIAGLEATSRDEIDLPIAFSHAIHENVGIFELYMTTHYRPVDSHCVHVDKRAPQNVKDAVEGTTSNYLLASIRKIMPLAILSFHPAGIVSCYREKFPSATLFVSEESHNVIYDHRSVLQADLACMNQLIRENDSWQVRKTKLLEQHSYVRTTFPIAALHELGRL